MKDKKNILIIFLLSIAALSVFGFFGYLFAMKSGITSEEMLISDNNVREYVSGGGGGGSVSGSSETRPETTQKPSPTYSPTAPPTAPPATNPPATAQASTNQSAGGYRIKDSDLAEFNDQNRGIRCLYPAAFSVDSRYTDTLFVARSGDGFAAMVINVAPAINPTDDFNNYIEERGGTIVMSSDNGGKEYEVLLHRGETAYYKYCIFLGEKMYWFEFINPIEDESVYSQYIEAIKNSFEVY